MTRKYGLLALVAIALLSAAAASYITQRRPAGEEAQVRAFLQDFMQARLARDDGKVRTFLSAEFHRRYVNQPEASLIGGVDPHYQRFHIESVTPGPGNSWIALVRIDEEQQGFAPAGWFIENIVLTQYDGAFRVDSVTPGAYEKTD